MSVDNLLFSECYYYGVDTDYRQGVKERLKELGLPLRKSIMDTGPSSITLFTIAKGRGRGYLPMHGRKRRREQEPLSYREIYA